MDELFTKGLEGGNLHITDFELPTNWIFRAVQEEIPTLGDYQAAFMMVSWGRL